MGLLYPRYLFGLRGGPHNGCMRLPRSASHRLSVSIPPTILIAAAVLLSFSSTNAFAASGQLSCDPCRLRFGTIVVGQSENLPVTVTNNQTSSVTVTAITSTDGEFSTSGLSLPVVVAAGQSLSFNVVFAPTVRRSAGGTMTFSSSSKGSNKALVLSVGGIGVSVQSLTSNPSTVAFGSVSVGSTGTVPVVLTNSGTTDIVIVQTDLSGTGFAMSGLTFPVLLSPKQTLAFNVTFTPQSGGAVSGNLIVPNGSLTIPLSGSGTTAQGQLTLNPAAVNFGDVEVGTTGAQSMTLSATGAAVTVTSSSSSSSLFALNGTSFPVTINKGQSISVNLGFTPKVDGSASGTLTFVSDASNSKALEALSGTGTSPQYSVNLSWNASNPPVAGYNVYRSTSLNGTYSKVNSALDPSTAYTDATVVSGQTYYYQATAVNSGGEESGPSVPATAVVP